MSYEEKLRGALSNLRPLDQEIITLRHFDELSNFKAAEILGLTPVAAGRLYIRAMKRLAEQFDNASNYSFQPFSTATTVVQAASP